MARTKREDNPRLQIFFELLKDVFTKGEDELTSRDFIKRESITNKSPENINRYCNDLVKSGFLILKLKTHKEGDKIKHRNGFYFKTTKENSYVLNWDNFAREIISEFVEEDFIEPYEAIKYIKEVLQSPEYKEFYQRAKGKGILVEENEKTKGIKFSKRFFMELFNPELLNNKNLSPKLKRAIKSIERLKERNRKFEKKLREEYCQESKLPKHYLIEPFLKTKKSK